MIYVGNRSTITTSLLPLSIKSHTIKFHMRVKEKAPHAFIELPECTAYLPVGACKRTKLDDVLHHGCLLCKVSLLFYGIGIGISLDAVTVLI